MKSVDTHMGASEKKERVALKRRRESWTRMTVGHIAEKKRRTSLVCPPEIEPQRLMHMKRPSPLPPPESLGLQLTHNPGVLPSAPSHTPT